LIVFGRAESLFPQLEKLFSTERIDELAEGLPDLESLFEKENVNSGGQALGKKLKGMKPDQRVDYLDKVQSVFVYAEMVRLLGAGMPNGYHGISRGLPETQEVYLCVLKGYSLDPAEADAGDVESTLSTSDQTRVCVLLGKMITSMPEKERVEFLGRLLKKTAQARKSEKVE